MNPFVFDTPLHPETNSVMLSRQSFIAEVVSRICAGEYCLILGPILSGRTTLLRAVKARLQVEPRQFPLIIDANDLNPTDENKFLSSLAAFLEQALRENELWPLSHTVAKYKIHENPDGINSFISELLGGLNRRLTLLFDNIEDISAHLLVRLANIAHGIFETREINPAFKSISFNFAGTISLRHLTSKLKPEVSPFNICTSLPLRDLALPQARDFLERVNDHFSLAFGSDGIAAILEYVGGDLNMLQKLAGLSLQADSAGVRRSTVERVVDALIQTDFRRAGEGLQHAVKSAEDDSQILDIILELFNNYFCAYRPSNTDDAMYGSFQITYPELAGALVLERPQGIPANWLFRNKLTELFFRHRFTPQHVVKTYLDLGQLNAAVLNCGALLKDLRTEFEGDINLFNERNLKDLLMVFTRRILTDDTHEYAYALLKRILAEGFGCSDATYYDYVSSQGKLVAVAFLSPLFNNDGSECIVNALENKHVLEVQACLYQRFKSENKDGQLHIALPLKDELNHVTAVVTVRTTASGYKWSQFEAKVRIMERALKQINIALRQCEKFRTLSSGRNSVRAFVAHEFNDELFTNLREHLRRALSIDLLYVDETHPWGHLLSAIMDDIKQSSLCLYEISTPNNNVYFECGLGLGLNLPGILFARDNSRARSSQLQIPPVLKGVLRFDYLNYTDIIERIAGRVSLILKTYSEKKVSSSFIHFLGAEMPLREKRCKYVAVLDHNHFGDQPDYRFAINEVCETARLQIVFPLDEHVEVERYLSTTGEGNGSARLMPRLMNVMALLQNADMIICRVEDFKDAKDQKERHIEGQAFIGLGYAFGMNELPNRKQLNIQMTLLSEDLNGNVIDAPSDLGGYTFLQYSNLGKLKALLRSKLPAEP